MSRYIDADEFKKENERLLHCDFPYLSEETLEELIDAMPTAEVAEIVRCKDCKHADLFYPYCTIWESAIDGDGYCYKGERE